MSKMEETNPSAQYSHWLGNIKQKIQEAQLKAHLKVNELMLQLYWEIGTDILAAQATQGWGVQVIDRLAQDIKRDSPNTTGFSVRNLKYMRSFADAYPHYPIVQVPLAELENEFVQVSLAQITMRGFDKPLGVAAYELEQLLKDNLNALDYDAEDEH